MVVSMRKLLILALFLATPALAQQTPVKAEKLPPPGAKQAAPAAVANEGPNPFTQGEGRPATAAEQALMLCQTKTIMGSTQDANVAGADYQAGVDAYGRPVASANGAATPQYAVPDRIEIPLNIAVLQSTGLITSPAPDLSTNVGNVTILKSGQVLFNNQDITSNVQQFCEKQLNVKVN